MVILLGFSWQNIHFHFGGLVIVIISNPCPPLGHEIDNFLSMYFRFEASEHNDEQISLKIRILQKDTWVENYGEGKFSFIMFCPDPRNVYGQFIHWIIWPTLFPSS